MVFSLTKNAIEYIHEKFRVNNEEKIILIYQINKNACVGSYLDYYVELTSFREIIKPELYEKFEKINDITIYIEKRILSDFIEAKKILIDIKKMQKFNDVFISLILKNR